MQFSRTLGHIGTLSVLGLVWTTTAAAQGTATAAPAPDTGQLADIVVTAEKRTD